MDFYSSNLFQKTMASKILKNICMFLGYICKFVKEQTSAMFGVCRSRRNSLTYEPNAENAVTQCINQIEVKPGFKAVIFFRYITQLIC
jgi:hypothetical protein